MNPFQYSTSLAIYLFLLVTAYLKKYTELPIRNEMIRFLYFVNVESVSIQNICKEIEGSVRV